VTLERPLTERRRQVRAALTPAGRVAFDGHLAALDRLVNRTAVATLISQHFHVGSQPDLSSSSRLFVRRRARPGAQYEL
jgi:hypothetical protein